MNRTRSEGSDMQKPWWKSGLFEAVVTITILVGLLAWGVFYLRD